MRRPPETSGPHDAARPRSAVGTLENAVARLSELLQRETAALRNRRPIDMDDFCDRKNQALLELSRIDRQLDRDTLDPHLAPALADLRSKLEENSAALRLHLNASQELADILTTAMQDAESDGTYTSARPGE